MFWFRTTCVMVLVGLVYVHCAENEASNRLEYSAADFLGNAVKYRRSLKDSNSQNRLARANVVNPFSRNAVASPAVRRRDVLTQSTAETTCEPPITATTTTPLATSTTASTTTVPATTCESFPTETTTTTTGSPSTTCESSKTTTLFQTTDFYPTEQNGEDIIEIV